MNIIYPLTRFMRPSYRFLSPFFSTPVCCASSKGIFSYKNHFLTYHNQCLAVHFSCHEHITQLKQTCFSCVSPCTYLVTSFHQHHHPPWWPSHTPVSTQMTWSMCLTRKSLRGIFALVHSLHIGKVTEVCQGPHSQEWGNWPDAPNRPPRVS